MWKGPGLFPGCLSRGKALVVTAAAMRFSCVVAVVVIALSALFALSSSTSQVPPANTQGDHNEEFLKAAKAGDAATVKTILEAGHSLSDETKNKALKATCLKAYTEVLQVLAANKATLNFSQAILDEVLVSAVCTKKPDFVMLLVGSSIEPSLGELNRNEQIRAFEFSLEGQSKALIQSARLGLADIVRFLLEGSGWQFTSEVTSKAAIHAFKGNHGEIVELLTSHGATPIPTPTNEALVEASKLGHTAIVEYLIECGFGFDHKYKCEALFEAASRGRTQVVEAFYNSNWEFEQEAYQYSLLNVCNCGHVEIAPLFLKKGKFEVESELKGQFFILSAKNNQLAMIKKFCEVCNFSGIVGTLALCYAAFEGHITIVNYLLDKNSGLKFSEYEKSQALVFADIKGNPEVVQCLLNSGATFSPKAIDTVLVHAGNIAELSMVESIFSSNFEFGFMGKHGVCNKALEIGSVDRLKLIFKKVKLEDSVVCAIIPQIGQEHFYSMLKFLVDEDIQFSTESVKELMLFYALYKDVRALKLLLSSNWQLSSNAKNEALRLAKKRHLNSAVECLEKNGATFDVALTGANLIEAAKGGHFETFMYIFNKGTGFTVKDKGDALFNAAEGGCREIVEHLIESKWCFSQASKDLALVKAASNVGTLVLSVILGTKWKFSVKTQKDAVFGAVKVKYPITIEALIEAFNFDQEFTEQVFISLCSTNCHFRMSFFIDRGVSPSKELKDKALIEATKNRNIGAIRDMVDAGFMFSSGAVSQALLEAAILDNPTTLKCLLSSGLQFTESAKERAFLASCKRGLTANVEHLLLRWQPSSPKLKDDALISTMKLGKIETFKYLIGCARGISFSEEDKNKYFIEASFGGHTEILECLMQVGFEPSTVTLNESLVWASRRGHAEVVTHLMKNNNAIFSIEAQSNSLSYAAKNRHVGIVQHLIRGGMSFEGDAKDKALIYASSKGHAEVVRCLIEETTGFSECGVSESLCHAVERDDSETVVLLLSKYKLGTDATNLALLYVSTKGNAAVVSSLLEGDSGPVLEEYTKREALCQASKNGHVAIVELLEKATGMKASVVSGASDEYSPLIDAIYDGNERTALYIAAHGDVRAEDISKAIDVAKVKGNAKTAEDLEKIHTGLLGNLKN